MTNLNASITVSALDNASAVIRSLGTNVLSALKNMSGPAAGVTTALAAVGGTAIAVAAQSTKMAADFQQAMKKNVALAGLGKDEFDRMSDSILSMAVKVGKAPTELANALYPIYSSGFKGAEGLNLLEKASMSSASGMVSATTVSNAAGAAFNAFNLRTTNTQENIRRMNTVMDVMNATVSAGNMQWSAYAVKVGDLAAKAAQSHVQFTEANAALAVFTNTGESVQLAGTHLGALFQSLALNTDTFVKRAKTLHESFDASKFKALDLAGKVAYLDQITGHDPGKVKAILGNATLTATFEKLKDHTKDYTATLSALKSANGATASAFAVTNEGFNQQMNRVKAAVDVLFIKLGTALLPVLTQLLSRVTPVILAFADWISKSHVIENAISAVGAVLRALPAIFERIQQALPLLISLVAGLGAAILAMNAGAIVTAITAIPAMITAFAALIPVMLTAAASAIAFAAPFILIGVAVAAVVFGIILAIQHWAQIVAFLQGVWSAFSSWFMGALRAIGDFFHHVWDGIVSFFQGVWSFLVNAAKIGAAFLLAVILGPFLAIGALFVWLYNHNYYFKAMIDAIVHTVQAGIAWLQNAWLIATGFIATQWQRLVTFAEGIWSKITATIKVYVDMVSAAIQSAWNFISGWLSAQWNKLAGFASVAWSAVSAVFASIWNTYIARPLSSLWDSISKWFSNLGKGASDSGKNFINMLVSGIESGAGAIWNAVTGIASQIWKALGFHSPAKAGPGADADKWMPNLVSMLSSGLTAGIPKMQAAVQAVAQPLAVLNPTVSRPGVLSPTSARSSTATTSITINVNVPFTTTRSQAQEIARVVEQELSRNLHRSGNLVTWTSGGRT